MSDSSSSSSEDSFSDESKKEPAKKREKKAVRKGTQNRAKKNPTPKNPTSKSKPVKTESVKFEIDENRFQINQKIAGYFTCPRSADIVNSSKTKVYADLSEFTEFVATADQAFGDNPCLIAYAKEGTKYAHIKCKFIGCVYA